MQLKRSIFSSSLRPGQDRSLHLRCSFWNKITAFSWVPGCASDGTYHKDISFHEIPSEKPRRKAWINAIRPHVGPYVQIVPGSTKVSSLHFRDEDYRQPCARTLPRSNKKESEGAESLECTERRHRIWAADAVPSVFSSFPRA